MALTLEATLVIPLTMAIMVGTISASVQLYSDIEADSAMESGSFLYTRDTKDFWSCKINENNTSWSKMIAVNPVREKDCLSLAVDIVKEIKDFIPIFHEMERMIFEDEK